MGKQGKDRIYHVMSFDINEWYTLEELQSEYKVIGTDKRFNFIPRMINAPILEGWCGPFPDYDGECIRYESPAWNKLLGDYKG